MGSKTIGLFEGVALYIAAILGSGVLFISGATASLAGPASLVSWLIVIMMSFPLAYTFACLSRLYPDAGGTATFVRISFGYHLGNIVGWFYFICASVGQTVVSLTGSFYVGSAFGLTQLQTICIALLILAIGGTTNYYGLRVSGKVALVISSLLLFLLVVAVIVSFPRIDWNQFVPFAPFGWKSVGTASTIIFWSYFGWEAICNLSTQFKRPQTDIVKSTFISAIIIGGLFFTLSLVTIGTATYGNMESNLSPIGVMMNNSLGLGAKVVTACLALIICTGTVNAFVASLAQLGYSLSRDGAFPKWLDTIHTKTNAPRRVVVLVICFSGMGVILTEVLSLTFYDILFIPTSLGVAVYILSMAAGIKLFKKGTWPWLTSLISFFACLAIFPFFELFIILPVSVCLLYFFYMKYVNRHGKRNEQPVLSLEKKG